MIRAIAFLHLTDAIEEDAVRIRMDTIHSMYVHTEKEEVFSLHGSAPVAVAEDESYTMIVYGPHGTLHGVKESIVEIEAQMADIYELAGIASLE